MNTLASLRSFGLGVMLGAGLTACSSNSLDNSLEPFQPQISNATDNFQLQATAVIGVTSTQTYSWRNTGTRATINHSTTTTAGTAQLTLRDGAGTVVYTKAGSSWPGFSTSKLDTVSYLIKIGDCVHSCYQSMIAIKKWRPL